MKKQYKLEHLHSIPDYAKLRKVTPQCVAIWIKNEALETTTISHKVFVYDENFLND